MKTISVNIIAVLTLLFSAHANERGLSKRLSALTGRDTVCNVWVHFKERPPRGASVRISDLAIQRRQRAGFKGEDRPVDPAYIKDIERCGGRLRHEFPWENAASFAVHSSLLNEIAALPNVKSVTPVAVYTRKEADKRALRKSAAPWSDAAGYGWHNEQVNIPLAHDYIKAKGFDAPGAGTVIAFFDTGFRLGHQAFTNGRDSGDVVVSAYDFVDRDAEAADPDSVNNDIWHPYYRNDGHGTQCLAITAGRDPGSYVGSAWGARFILARTEDYVNEVRAEEDNWAAAAVWAEKQGAHIISSSLGYRDEFDDAGDDYAYADMNGINTVISKAAAGAVARGVIVVNAMGNEGSGISGTIVAPADVDGVVAVGAVDGSLRLAHFSGSGPTADGRSKPDVVAPGVSVPLVDPYKGDGASYTIGNGTSYATPIVSGIFALILQANPGIGAVEARERLYKSCSFAQGQTAAGDNMHGYGIPDALRAVMNDDEIFVRFTDSSGNPLRGAVVRIGADTYTANESGGAVITARPSALPLALRVTFRGETLQTITVNELPFVGELALDVNVNDGLKALPNPVMRNNRVKGRYCFTLADVSQPATAVIRTVNGRTVWNQKLQVRSDGSAEFIWDCKTKGGRKIAAGVYFLTIRYGRNSISRRLVVAN